MSAADAVRGIIPARGFKKPRRAARAEVRAESVEPIQFQKLQAVHAPVAAVSKVRQACANVRMSMRGMDLGDAVAMEGLKQPSQGCALILPALYEGYMSSTSVQYASDAHSIAPMVHSEQVELEDACLGVIPEDESALPRKCAVWLAITGGAVHAGASKMFLDAFSHIATTQLHQTPEDTARIASLVRMSAVAGADADWVLKTLAKESGVPINIVELSRTANMVLVVRWCYDVHGLTPEQRKNYDDGELRKMLTKRSEFVVLNNVLQLRRGVAEQCPYLEAIATTLLSINQRYNLGMPAKMAACEKQVSRNAFVRNTILASKDFFNEMTGTPVRTLSQYASSRAFFNKLLEHTEVYVRIVPFDAETSAWCDVNDNRCFHGFLLSNPERKEDALVWAKENEEGLPAPDPTFQLDWAMHLCCPWTERYSLKSKVTLYGSKGILRRPISPPGSCIEKTTPIVVPIEETLLKAYKLIPCSRDSTYPGFDKLMKPFEHVMMPVFEMYSDMRQGQAARILLRKQLQMHLQQMEAISPDVESPEMPACAGRQSPRQVFDPEVATERQDESYLLNAFGIDPESTRVSVGDAYSRLLTRRAPTEITEMLLQASIRLGIHGSIRDAFREAAKAMQTLTNADQNNGTITSTSTAYELEMQRLRTLAAAHVRMHQSVNEDLGKRCNFGLQAGPTSKVRKVLQACSFTEKGLDVRIGPTNMEEGETLSPDHARQAVNALSQAMRVQSTPGVEEQARQVLVNPTFLEHSAENMRNPLRSLLHAAAHVLQKSSESDTPTTPATPFFLSRYEDLKDQTAVQRMSPSGEMREAKLGDLVDASRPAVLVAEYMNDGSARLTVPKMASGV